jgi:hypothetical protein
MINATINHLTGVQWCYDEQVIQYVKIYGLIRIGCQYVFFDHDRRESVKRYVSVQLDEKRRLLEGKVVDMQKEDRI